MRADAEGQDGLTVLFTGRVRGLDSRDPALLTFGLDPESYAGLEGDPEDLKQIKTQFGIFMLWALAAAAPHADLDKRDVKTVQDLMARANSSPSEAEKRALQNIRAALIAKLRELVPDQEIPDALFQNGLNLNMSIVNALLQSYRSAARIRQAA